MRVKAFTTTCALLAFSACAGAPSGDGLSPVDLKSVLYVNNQYWDTVRIYYVPDNGSSAVRIGAVNGSTNSEIDVKGQMEAAIRGRGRIRLMLWPIASNRRFVTQPVVVSPGEDLQLVVQTQLDMSYVIPGGRNSI